MISRGPHDPIPSNPRRRRVACTAEPRGREWIPGHAAILCSLKLNLHPLFVKVCQGSSITGVDQENPGRDQNPGRTACSRAALPRSLGGWGFPSWGLRWITDGHLHTHGHMHAYVHKRRSTRPPAKLGACSSTGDAAEGPLPAHPAPRLRPGAPSVLPAYGRAAPRGRVGPGSHLLL